MSLQSRLTHSLLNIQVASCEQAAKGALYHFSATIGIELGERSLLAAVTTFCEHVVL